MRLLTLCLIGFVSLVADMEVSGHLDLNTQTYLIKPQNKHKNSFTLKQTIEFKNDFDDLSLYAKLYAQEDYFDLLSAEQHNDRTFARLDELYLKYDLEDDSVSVGKSVKFWGALELRNIVDAFNPQELRDDMFETNKLGAWNISYSHYSESAEMGIIVKLNEQNQPMATKPYVYYFFPEFITYKDSLNTSNGKYRPSIYLTYIGSTDSEYALDYAVIFQNGYDSLRYFTPDKPQNLSPLSPTFGYPTEFTQNAYLVNKIMTYNTLVVDATLIKLEALFAKVDDEVNVGDYSHIAFGVEHTLENFYESASLGLIAEYYKFDTYESDKYDDLELFETMQNDIFVGVRYSFNNAQSSSIIGGVVADFEYNEEIYYMKLDSRVGDMFKVALDYYYIEPSEDITTAYSLLGRHQRVGLNVAWYF